MRLLGFDPGLRNTGWGVIDAEGNRLKHVAQGVVRPVDDASLAVRLGELYRLLGEVLDKYRPDAAAVEETFVNKNPGSTLKLGMARGVVLLAPAERGIPVFEYATNLVKKSVVGVGHADKAQVQMMVKRLLPGATSGADACDALAVAICHAHHAATKSAVASSLGPTPSPSHAPHGPLPLPAGARVSEIAAAKAPSPQRGEGWGEGAFQKKSDGAKRKPTPLETGRARRLRRDATDAEKLLWSKLRNAQLEQAKFRRQEPILGFTADFVCHEKRLIVELDGGQHSWQTDKDERRTRMLEQAGFRVVRFWNNDVLGNLDGVLEQLRESLLIERAAL
ncbi:MAG TPA: crossover junction endodeoxyribonuclease RuvC [Stellaceae bacterium]|jgi:crossover junction endodeoxyribonuclease RuvC|nr:crossover junction endodeoxyribonuclease RuvC [Stellaceae bacterium]